MVPTLPAAGAAWGLALRRGPGEPHGFAVGGGLQVAGGARRGRVLPEVDVIHPRLALRVLAVHLQADLHRLTLRLQRAAEAQRRPGIGIRIIVHGRTREQGFTGTVGKTSAETKRFAPGALRMWPQASPV